MTAVSRYRRQAPTLRANSASGIGEVTDFLREKLDWHRDVMRDPSLTNLAKTVASLLLHDFDWRQSGAAYRSQEGLAEAASCTVRAIQKGLSQLAFAGHLEVITAKGRGHTNRYRFSRKRANGGSSQLPENLNAGSPQAAENTNVRSQKDERTFARVLKGNPFPPSPQRTACVEAASGSAGQGLVSVPTWLRERIASGTPGGEAWVGSWIDPCSFDEATSTLHPRSDLARGRIREEAGRMLTAIGVTLGPSVARGVS